MKLTKVRYITITILVLIVIVAVLTACEKVKPVDSVVPEPIETEPKPTATPTATTPPEHLSELKEGYAWFEWEGKAIQYPETMEASTPISGMVIFKNKGDQDILITLMQVKNSDISIDEQQLTERAKTEYGGDAFQIQYFLSGPDSYVMKFSLTADGNRQVVGEQRAKIDAIPGEVSMITLITDPANMSDELSTQIEHMLTSIENKPI